MALRNNTYWERIGIAGKSFSLKRVRDPDIILNAITEERFAEDERLPYWADLWPSAFALATYIIENQHEFRLKTALEIGCGLGLCGIAASSVGMSVTFSDYDPWALKFTSDSFKRNFNRKASVQLLDWRYPESGQRFDMILAADVLYEKRWLRPVIGLIEANIEQKGMALIAEPNRPIAREFFTLIGQKKWQVRSLLKDVTIYNKLHQVSINRITRC